MSCRTITVYVLYTSTGVSCIAQSDVSFSSDDLRRNEGVPSSLSGMCY